MLVQSRFIKIFQDSLSTIALIKRGRSTSQRTRHIDIRYFFIHDRIGSGEAGIASLASELMVGDFFSKPLTGGVFFRFRPIIMGFD